MKLAFSKIVKVSQENKEKRYLYIKVASLLIKA